VHGFTDDVLAQHGTDDGETVTGAGERCPAGAFEMDVAKLPVDVRDLTQQEGTPVAQEGRVAAELVAGIGLGHRRGTLRDPVADQQQRPLGRPQRGRVQAQLAGQRLVQDQQLRVRGFLRLPGNRQLLEFAGETPVKGER